MSLPSAPTRGMRDLLPDQVARRSAVAEVIVSTYRSFGFAQVETPCVESLDLLSRGEGGDNEKLMFKILKRGEQLRISAEATERDLADLALRFDLTLPLARFYAEHQARLPAPFRALQLGPVWRAERPQKGRFRQFVQCDVDIVGEPGVLAEIELVGASAEALAALGLAGFVIRVNDRALLSALADAAGVPGDRHGSAFIALDKLDKIGAGRVHGELVAHGLAEGAADQLLAWLTGPTDLGELPVPDEIGERLASLVEVTGQRAAGRWSVRFDPSVVRGMGYYTGPIYEFEVAGWPGSIAAGGRYDGMLASLGRPAPAAGCSIGFERVVEFLEQEGRAPAPARSRVAVLVERPADLTGVVLERIAGLRAGGAEVAVLTRRRKVGQQRKALAGEGYAGVVDLGEGGSFEVRPLAD